MLTAFIQVERLPFLSELLESFVSHKLKKSSAKFILTDDSQKLDNQKGEDLHFSLSNQNS